MITIEYGAMSSKYSVEAPNKYTAYVAMIAHFDRSAHLIAIYSPLENKEDSWLNITGQISDRLDDIFGGVGSFDRYVSENSEEIRLAYGTIKKLI